MTGSSPGSAVLVFALGAQRFALPAPFVRRIEHPAPLTRVPNGPPWVDGLANLTGEVVAVVDTARWLGIPAAPASDACRWLVLAYEGDLVALTISQLPVLRVVEPLAPHALAASDPLRRCASGTLDLDGEIVVLLDPACLMGDGRRVDSAVVT